MKRSTYLEEDGKASEHAPLYEEPSSPIDQRRTGALTTPKALAFHLAFFAMYTLVFVLICFSHHSKCSPSEPAIDILSPAVEAIKFGRLSYSIDAPSIYKGNPSPELDTAWEQLLKGYNLRLSPEQLKKIDRKSIELADGSGDYWGILDSFHNLHCLKNIRHHLAPDYYQQAANYDHPQDRVYPPHIEHCIESLRLYVMCKGDITVQTFDWIDDKPKAKANYTAMVHQCVDWPRLQAWAIKHSFNLSAETISHPKYGGMPSPSGSRESPTYIEISRLPLCYEMSNFSGAAEYCIDPWG